MLATGGQWGECGDGSFGATDRPNGRRPGGGGQWQYRGGDKSIDASPRAPLRMNRLQQRGDGGRLQRSSTAKPQPRSGVVGVL